MLGYSLEILKDTSKIPKGIIVRSFEIRLDSQKGSFETLSEIL